MAWGQVAMIKGALWAGLALAQPVMAQDVTYDFRATTDCLAGLGKGESADRCTGVAAQRCMEHTDGAGSSTVGMTVCLGLEHADWDRRLNHAYGLLMTRYKAEDEEMATLGVSAPKMAPALLDMQRAWISFRDRTCDYERAKWGGGTGGGPATAACLMTMTARQALSLEDDLNGYGAPVCNHEGC